MDQLLKMFGVAAPIVVVLVVLALFILPQAVRILREYERGVIFRLGKLIGAKGPGMVSSKSLMPKTRLRSAEAKTPKLETCMSPQS